MSNHEQKGLEGIIAGETALSTVGKAGVGLTYRGYDIHELAEKAAFEEVAYLLIYGELPTEDVLAAYRERLTALRTLPRELQLLLETIPGTAHPMDVLRTGISLLGTLEPESKAHDAMQIADRLLAIAPSMLLYWHQFYHKHKRLAINEFHDDRQIATFFLHALTGHLPEENQRRALDVALILYAEHEFNASTFAARVTTSTASDFYSAIVSAIGTLRGPLHGGANEEAMRLIGSFSAVSGVEASIQKQLSNKEKIMGFGHRVYKISDPRSDVMKIWAKQLSAQSKQPLFEIAETIEKTMWREKKLFPNLDFYGALVFHECHIPTPLFTPIFVMSRLSGWSAHILEQRSNNRLIRPEATYIGPPNRAFRAMHERA